MSLHPDFKDILVAFATHKVEYVIVGGYAVAFHGQPRFTKDLDLWINPTGENVDRTRAALVAFGAPDDMVSQLETAAPLDVLWMGVPPIRIDVVKGVPGGDFAQVYARRVEQRWDGVPVFVVGREDLIALKRASGRPQDLLDAEALAER